MKGAPLRAFGAGLQNPSTTSTQGNTTSSSTTITNKKPLTSINRKK